MDFYAQTAQAAYRRSKKDKDVAAVMLFGSAARGEKHRDIDVAIVLKPIKHTSSEMFGVRSKYTGVSDKLDVHIFQQLPLDTQRCALKDKKILLCNDEDALYDVVFASIRATEDFMARLESLGLKDDYILESKTWPTHNGDA